MTRVVVKFIVNGRTVIIDSDDQGRVFDKNWQLDGHGRVGHMQRKKGLPIKWFSLPRFIDGTPKGVEIDHINRLPLDNRKSNLRRCSRAENERNKGPVKGNYKGVCFEKRRGKWKAAINIGNNKKKHLGYFDCEISAAKKYNKVASEMWGEFAWLNPV